jgi:transposase
VLGQKLFTPKVVHEVNLDERVPQDHLLRRIAEVVDFSFVRRLTARFYSHTGQPGIDPVVLFKMALLGYLYGITSERRLAEELRLHLAYMWFVGYDLDERTPDHSVLSKARRRFGVTVYQAFFTEVIHQCERAGLIDGRTLYVDSTLVKANAALGSRAARALVAQLASVDEHVAALWRENPNPTEQAETPDPSSDPSALPASPTPTNPEVMVSTALHVATRADPPNGSQGAINRLVVSRTDPDAGLVARDGVPLGFYYKAHLGVDGGRQRVITAVEVTPGEVADEYLLDRLLKEHIGITHRQVEEVVADTKYGTHANYVRLEAAGIRATIPPHSAMRERGAYRTDQFVYDLATDRYRCPTGQYLRRQGSSHTAGAAGGIIYRGQPKVCGACPVKSVCCPTGVARTVFRPDDSDLRERTLAHLRTPGARRHRVQRSCWCETANAEMKERHGLHRAQFRGRDQVAIQALAAAMAYNIKKLAGVPRPQPTSVAVALTSPIPLTPLASTTHSQQCMRTSARFNLAPWRFRSRQLVRPRRAHPAPSHRCSPEFGNRPLGSI